MAHDLRDDLELVGADDYFDQQDFGSGFGFGGDESGGGLQNEHTDDDDDGTTTSASDYYQRGKDMQGIPWERLNYSRDQYRDMRLRQYKSYHSLPRSPRSGLQQECQQVERKDTFFDFQFNTRAVKSTIVHFQEVYNKRAWMSILSNRHDNCDGTREYGMMLRNLLWATSKHDVYTVQNYSVMHWSPLLQRGTEVLNVAGQLAPAKQEVRGARPLSRVQISAMSVKDNLLVAGGFQGELICKDVSKPGVAFCTSLTGNNNSITNAVDIYESPNGATRLMAANNDCVVRTFDTERFSLLAQFTFPWSVNNTSVSPDGKLVAVLGDSPEVVLADSQSGRAVSALRGHHDYSFASAWHPGGHVLATGNQDATCRLWDVRRPSRALAVLPARIGAVRGLRFSPDGGGRFLAAAEAADFVHVYDTAGVAGCGDGGAAAEQEVDLFGEIAGAAFSPDGEAMFVSVADRTYGGLLEFRRRRAHDYLDSYFF